MTGQARRLLARFAMLRAVACCSALLVSLLAADAAAQPAAKLDAALQSRATLLTGQSPIIVQPLSASVDFVIQSVGGVLGRALPSVDGRVATVPNPALLTLASNFLVQKVALDRPTISLVDRTGVTVGATAVRSTLGYNGNGVGVAVIDSGVALHDDLYGSGVPGGQRVDRFVDFVNGQALPYDDYGHGTHVAGIIAGTGYDSNGARSGIAPRAHLVVLKALNSSGSGRISNVIAALDYAVNHQAEFNIRVVNLSIAAGVYESYTSDLLAQATKHAVEHGIVVVAAAGNFGRGANGQTQYGAITAPGNAPWVITVGASSHMGTVSRTDDIVPLFSSRGPTRFDYAAKPDLVAPGVGIESLSAPGSTLYSNYSAYLLGGTVPTSYPPYLSLTGTSMATPVVTGTVALMLEANPALTPNAVKAILQYSAEVYGGYDPLTQGAGFLNAAGAVELARYFSQPTLAYPSDPTWSRQIIWGNRRIQGGRLLPDVNAWALDKVWGSPASIGGTLTWGDIANGTLWSPWSTTCSTATCDAASWGADASNVVWSYCGGADCSGKTWAASDSETVVWGTNGDGTVVWGTSDDGTVVWGTSDQNTVVWGTNGDETVVWGTSCGTDCQPVIWNQ